jgi:hypothetical protein
MPDLENGKNIQTFLRFTIPNKLSGFALAAYGVGEEAYTFIYSGINFN